MPNLGNPSGNRHHPPSESTGFRLGLARRLNRENLSRNGRYDPGWEGITHFGEWVILVSLIKTCPKRTPASHGRSLIGSWLNRLHTLVRQRKSVMMTAPDHAANFDYRGDGRQCPSADMVINPSNMSVNGQYTLQMKSYC